jgi:hypothetical protein
MTFSDLRGLEFAGWPRWGEPPQPPSRALSSRVQSLTDDARQAPHSRLQERTRLPSRTPPVSPPQESESSRLEVSSSESVSHRVRTTEHTRRRSTACTCLPDRPAPRKVPNARRDSSHNQLLLHSGWTVNASLAEPLPPSAEPCGRPRSKLRRQDRVPPRRHLHRCSPRSGVATFARRSPRTLTSRQLKDSTPKFR